MPHKRGIFYLLITVATLVVSNITYSQTANEVKMQQFNQTLHDQLPTTILKKGYIHVVDIGTVPPFYLYKTNTDVEGASIDLLNALGEILGIKITRERVGDLPALLMGIKSGRYDMSITPLADTLARQNDYEFVDYLQEYVSLVVVKGNPKNIHAYGDLCGKTLALQVGGSAERRARYQTERCVNEGKPAINISTYKDAASSFLALNSGRADAYQSMAAIGAYYVALSDDKLELVDVGLRDDFPFPDKIFNMGIAVQKNSPLTTTLFAAMQELFDNGTYATIMKKWGADKNMVNAPGINLGQ